MTTFNNDPNFSVVIPGGCNAKCAFCFAKDKEIKSASVGDYVFGLVTALQKMPTQFYQISITGGEPTISPYLLPALSAMYMFKEKYTNILLTTNGTGLYENAGIIGPVVDHINISRHHYDEAENARIFSGSYNVYDKNLEEIIDKYSVLGVDITANCVINDSTEREFIEKYIQWAKCIGFQAVRFRKENGSLDKTPVEETYAEHKVKWEGACPVCRTTKQYIHGFNVFWKSSVLEPSNIVKDVFEVVYAPDGKLYLDWEYKKPLVEKEPKKRPPVTNRSKMMLDACGGSSVFSCGARHC